MKNKKSGGVGTGQPCDTEGIKNECFEIDRTDLQDSMKAFDEREYDE